MRSLVFAVLSYYHKGRNMTGQNKPRMTFLTEAHSVLWHYWNAYIRPAAVFALQVLNEPERAQQMATYVWVHSEKGVLDTDDFSLILQRLFHEGGVAKLGVRDWRQASVAIVDAHIKTDPTSVNDTSIFEAQRGHSGKTANMHYAGTGGYDIDRNSETRYRAASHAMHKFWGIDSIRKSDFVPIPQEDKMESIDLARKALRLYTEDQDAEFRTTFQSDWVKAIFDRNKDYLIVARTGGGKSLAYTLPPMVELKGTTVIIQPLKALVAETSAELTRKRIPHLLYSHHRNEIQPYHRVLVCTTDKASEPAFHAKLTAAKDTLNRVIIDECHCYEDDVDYRRYASGVANLRSISVPFFFMTATMQIGHENSLFKLFNIHNIDIQREITARPELYFKVNPVCLDIPKALAQIYWKLVHKDLHERDRNIIFIENKDFCAQALAILAKKDVPAAIYHSDLPDHEAEEQVTKWQTTPKCVIIATSGFGAGINYKHVRNVFIYGLPKDSEINKAFQEAGRAGRDLQPANVEFFPSGPPEEGTFAHSLKNQNNCIPGLFAQLLDGKLLTCPDFSAINPCFHCALLNKSATAKRKESAILESSIGYNVNVKKSKDHQAMLSAFTMSINSIRKGCADLCGWCLAIDGKREKHKSCPRMTGCFKCTSNAHSYAQCNATRFSDSVKKSGTQDKWKCPFCGLPKAYDEQAPFHKAKYQPGDKTCDSGLRDVCERYCWHMWWNKKDELLKLVGTKLELPTGEVETRQATTEQFSIWLGYHSWLNCPWANAVTLFVVKRDSSMCTWL
ncbi:P-loop containing nucleoside triphosphate hydrolase protein [Melampsora americana]|nr:P-loop containing nucleoside triphosphate hydrolase protein [Melampsora americana]